MPLENPLIMTHFSPFLPHLTMHNRPPNRPITVQTHSPLELVHQYFVRLGVRYLIVNDEKGYYRGVIFKKRYVFLSLLCLVLPVAKPRHPSCLSDNHGEADILSYVLRASGCRYLKFLTDIEERHH